MHLSKPFPNPTKQVEPNYNKMQNGKQHIQYSKVHFEDYLKTRK